ncbi:MAG: cupin domain-containing protein [Bacteriovoracaceae bacterium]|nr:cupin domain-containing protein [Bacteriovoracaceae bacterium]
MNPSLDSLLRIVSRDEFLKAYKLDEPLLVHNPINYLSEITSLPLLSSLESLINSWPESVNVYLPGINDEVNSAQVDKQEAQKLFKDGFGLFFDDPNRFNEVIDTWLKAIHRDLGLSQLTYSRSLIYAISKGHGTATHFDQNINFVLQVSGVKKWWLAKNNMVTNPMTRFTLGSAIDPELETYLEGEIPKDMPSDALEIELKPGSVLFVPRGIWHKTEAQSDAISLNFTYSAPTWIDLLTSCIRANLSQSPSWRATADFVNDPILCLEAEHNLNDLMDELKKELNQIKAHDILGATEFKPYE